MTMDIYPTASTAPAAGLQAWRDPLYVGIALAVFIVFALTEFWGNWAVDFSAYYYAGRFFGLGEFAQIYAGPPDIIGPEMPARWGELVAADGFGDAQTYPFIYLPWIAWAMAPVAAHVPVMVAMNVMLLVNMALVAASVYLAWRLFAPATRIGFGMWAMLSLAIMVISALPIMALSLGQIQIPVFAMILLAFERYRAGKPVFAALLLAAATMMKITPAAFAIIFLWDLNWRALGTYIATTLALFALSVGVAGWELHAQYFDIMRRLSAQLFMANIGASLEAFLFQTVDLIRGTPLHYVGHEYSVDRPAWLDPAVKGVFVLGLGAIWLATRGLAAERRVPEQLFALAILLPLCAPLGWIHYYLLATYMLPALFGRRGASTYALYFGFLLLTTLWVMYFLIGIRGPVMMQIIVYVPFFIALLVRVVTLGTAPRSAAAG